MDLKQAIRLAGQTIDAECKRLAVNANLFEVYGMESGRPMAERRARLRKAKAVLFALVGYPLIPGDNDKE